MKNWKWTKLLIVAVLLLSVSMSFTTRHAKAEEDLSPKREMRAAWIATVQNIDMKAGMNEQSYTTWAAMTLEKLKNMNFNTVIFQVKPTTDALYPSEFAPWSQYITGKAQGTDPGYDPLQIMIEEAHKRGIEVHAWVNPYRITMPFQTLESLDPSNPARVNPDWVVKYGFQYYFDPGIPEVQEYLLDTVKELVENYDIEAVHMDDYFYPYRRVGEEFPDQESFKKYGGEFTSIEDWRRDNVNHLVAEINRTVKETKSWVQFGISPFGVWRNIAMDPTGSNTQAGQTNYDDLYADTRQWIKDGTIDYITPQLYWTRSFAVASYSVLLDWWNKEVTTYAGKHPVHLYIGMADYKVGDNFDQAWYEPYELPGQILDNRKTSHVTGQMHFSMRQIEANRLGYADILANETYKIPALAPALPWNGAKEPSKPTNVKAVKEGSNVTLSIKDHKEDARKFVIYRFDGTHEGDYNDPRNIVGVVYRSDEMTTFIDTVDTEEKMVTYGVTSLSPTGVESVDAKTLRVNVK